MSVKILMWGGGSQARLLKGMVDEQKLGKVVAVFDETCEPPSFLGDIPLLRTLEELLPVLSSATHYIVSIGGHYGFARHKISEVLRNCGLSPLSVIHPTSFIDKTVILGRSLIAMPNVTVNKFSRIGDDVVLNTSCTIDHECTIGNGVHIMGSSALAGRIEVGNFATIGTNATILPDLCIARGAYIGGGTVVISDVAKNTVVAGTPAKFLRTAVHSIQNDILDKIRQSKGI